MFFKHSIYFVHLTYALLKVKLMIHDFYPKHEETVRKKLINFVLQRNPIFFLLG